jgi:hypothetical protein
MKKILTILFMLVTSVVFSQATLTDLNLVFDIREANSYSSPFLVKGTVMHSTSEYNGNQILVGDLVYFQDGPATYSLPISTIVSQSYSYVELQLLDISGTIPYIPTGRAALIRTSNPDLLPVPPDGIPSDLSTGILNDLRLKIQNGVTLAEEITDYVGSAGVIPAVSASSHTGEWWRNSSGEGYRSNGTIWLPVGGSAYDTLYVDSGLLIIKGPNDSLSTPVIDIAPVQSLNAGTGISITPYPGGAYTINSTVVSRIDTFQVSGANLILSLQEDGQPAKSVAASSILSAAGGISGTLATGQVAYGSGTNTITSNSGLLYNGTQLSTPSNTAGSTFRAGNIEIQGYDIDNGMLLSNAYFNGGSYIRRSTSGSSLMLFNNGNILFRTDVSGTAGSASVPLTQTKFIIDNVGNIGASPSTSSDSKFRIVQQGSNTYGLKIEDSSSSPYAWFNGGTKQLGIRAAPQGTAPLYVSDGTNGAIAIGEYVNGGMYFSAVNLAATQNLPLRMQGTYVALNARATGFAPVEMLRATDTGVGIGITVPTSRLHVAGADNLTTGWTAQFHNSNVTPSNSLMIRNDGNVGVGTNAPSATLHIKTTGTASNVAALRVETGLSTDAAFAAMQNGDLVGINNNFQPFYQGSTGRLVTSTVQTNNGTTGSLGLKGGYTGSLGVGVDAWTTVAHTTGDYRLFSTGTTFQPPSGNATFSFFSTAGLINQTSGATGITRGFWMNSSLTNPADFRAFEASNTTGKGFWQTGTGVINSFMGSTGVGTASPSAQLHTTGTVRFEGYPNTLNSAGSPVNILSTSSTGVLESHTPAELVSAGGGLTGNGVATQIPVYSGANTFTRYNGFSFISETQGMLVGALQFNGFGTGSGYTGQGFSSPGANRTIYLNCGTNNNASDEASAVLNAGVLAGRNASTSFKGIKMYVDLQSNGGGTLNTFSMLTIEPLVRHAMTTIVGIDYNPVLTSQTNHYAALFRSGDVGIGLAAPTAKLHVRGSNNLTTGYTAIFQNSELLNTFLIRNDGIVGIGNVNAQAKFNVESTSTITTGSAYGQILLTTVNPPSASSATNTAFRNYLSISGASNMTGALIGNSSVINDTNSGAKTSIVGTDINITSSGGTTTNVSGATVTIAYGDVPVAAATMRGYTAVLKGNATIGSCYYGRAETYFVRTPTTFRVFDADLTTVVTATTPTSYGLYQNGNPTGARNYMNAPLVIGSDITPAQNLHIQGTARITGSDGTATLLMGRDADGDISNLGLGLGLSITSGTLNVADQSATNEIQTLSLVGSTLSLSVGGGSVTLPSGAGATNLAVTGTSSPLTLTSDTGTDITFTAGSGTSLTGTSSNITINNTGDTNATDDLTTSTFFDGDIDGNWDGLAIKTNVIMADHIVDGQVTMAKIANAGATSGQIISWNGTAWTPSNIGYSGTGDVSGTAASLTVSKIQGRGIATTAPTTNQVLAWTGSLWAPASPGLVNLNGQNGTSQTFFASSTGTDFNITSSGNVHTFALPTANSTQTGKLTSSDWTTFNNKIGGSGANNQLAVFNGTGTVTSSTGATYNGTVFSITGEIVSSGVMKPGTLGTSPTVIVGRNASNQLSTVGVGAGLDFTGGTLSASNLYTADGTLTGSRTITTSNLNLTLDASTSGTNNANPLRIKGISTGGNTYYPLIFQNESNADKLSFKVGASEVSMLTTTENLKLGTGSQQWILNNVGSITMPALASNPTTANSSMWINSTTNRLMVKTPDGNFKSIATLQDDLSGTNLQFSTSQSIGGTNFGNEITNTLTADVTITLGGSLVEGRDYKVFNSNDGATWETFWTVASGYTVKYKGYGNVTSADGLLTMAAYKLFIITRYGNTIYVSD